MGKTAARRADRSRKSRSPAPQSPNRRPRPQARAPRRILAVWPRRILAVWPQIALGAALVLMVFIAYRPALNAGYVWDDEAVWDNYLLRDAEGLRLLWTDPAANARHEPHFWPITYTSFWLEAHLRNRGPNLPALDQMAPIFHKTNVFLHSVNAVLLWLLLRRFGLPGAWVVAAIFGLHPTHVESVAWIIERKDLLYTLFYLCAFFAFLRFERRRDWRAYAGTVALLVGAMLCKSMAVTFPAALALWLWWKNGRLTIRDAAALAPLFVVAGAIALWDASNVKLYHQYASNLSFAQRVLAASRAFWHYVWKIFWPLHLMPVYPRWEIRASSPPAWMFPAACLAAAGVLAWGTRVWGRGPLAALLFSAATYAPILGFVDFTFMNQSFVGDRFQYMASVGLTLLAVPPAARWAAKWRPHGPRLAAVAAGALLAALGALTWRQAALYKDMEGLFRYNIALNPNSWSAQNNVGHALNEQERWAEALPYLNKSLELNPINFEARLNRGRSLHKTGQIDAAIRDYEEAARLKPLDVKPRINLGAAWQQKGRLDKAIQFYEEALNLEPQNAIAHNNYGLALCQTNRVPEGLEQFRIARTLQPDYDLARKNLVIWHINYGAALLQAGRIPEGLEQFRAALTFGPNDPVAHNQYGLALCQTGHVPEGLEEFRAALRLNPDFEEARKNLEAYGAPSGQGGAAAATGPAAVETKP
ncbi:MAG: tetratricopeptide repeat protein [Candidatus Sumerlaeota bacterium]|nr:tetratricopeptide repeat protein [Candidatus Sumerlaeota bacterium]